MPTAKVETPDGKIMTLEVPEGATQDQILSFARSQYGTSTPAPAAPAPAQETQQPQQAAMRSPEGVSPYTAGLQMGLQGMSQESGVLTGRDRQTEETRTLPRATQIGQASPMDYLKSLQIGQFGTSKAGSPEQQRVSLSLIHI